MLPNKLLAAMGPALWLLTGLLIEGPDRPKVDSPPNREGLPPNGTALCLCGSYDGHATAALPIERPAIYSCGQGRCPSAQ